MGCSDFELDLSMAPGHARELGEELGSIEDVKVDIDGFGLKISDNNNSRVPMDQYLRNLASLVEKPYSRIEGTARENFVAGIVGATIINQIATEQKG